jgi:hypothetical protein
VTGIEAVLVFVAHTVSMLSCSALEEVEPVERELQVPVAVRRSDGVCTADKRVKVSVYVKDPEPKRLLKTSVEVNVVTPEGLTMSVATAKKLSIRWSINAPGSSSYPQRK